MADNPSNIVPDNLIVIEGGKQLVPAPAPSDAGKVLGVVNASGDIGWVVDQGGTLTQVQSDWAETDPTKVSFINNKPSIPSKTSDLQNDSGFITASSVPTKTSELQNDSGFITSSDIPAIPTKTSDLQNDSGFITSADVPAQVQSNWNETNTGSAAYIQNKPAIPSKTSDLQNDSGFITSSDIPAIPTKTSDLQNDSGFITSSDIPAQVQSDWNETNTSSAAYIQNKPTIPPGVTVDQTYNASSTNAQSGTAVAEAIAAIPAPPTYSEGDGIDITNNVVSADVDGTTIGIDSTTHKIKSLQVIPTKTSDLQNDSGFITSSDIPAIPTKTSDLQNDSGFITSSDIPAQVQSDWNESDSSSAAYIRNKPTIPPAVTVDQTYNASSTNAQSGVAVASAVAGVNAVPASTSSDENKVLTVNSSGTPVWAASAVPASKPLVQGSGITITDGQNDVTISASADQVYSASSTNAQSGVAVASAIAGINQVPASTSADEDKVLTVNSSGTPVWATAQGGGGGSGGDSEFPYDPGYMHTGWNKMIVRFGDTTYDPTTAASASSFSSIVAMNEPGTYEFTFDTSTTHNQNLFKDEWNDFVNNPVDVLQLTSNNQSLGGKYGTLFMECTGLRSVWNFRGDFGSIAYWFYGCTNLQAVSGKIPEYHASHSSRYADQIFLRVTNINGLFEDCVSAKKIELIVYGSRYRMDDACRNCSSIRVGLGFYGLITTLDTAFSSCSKMSRLYGVSDFPDLFNMNYVSYLIDNPASYNYTSSCYYAFGGCVSFRDFNGSNLALTGPFTTLSHAFDSCMSLTEIPRMVLASTGCDIGNMCAGATNLRKIPDIDYSKVTAANYCFDSCKLLNDDASKLSGLSNQCSDVSGLLSGCWSISKGCTELYTALNASGTAVTTHSDAFTQAGMASGNDQRSQIPSSWGGTGA